MRLHNSISVIAGLVTICIGSLVVFGWLNDIEALKSIIPGFVTMKFTTAVPFIFSGLMLIFSQNHLKGDAPWSLIVIPPLALVVLLLMITLLAASLLHLSTGIENLFVQESVEAVQTISPGRPSYGTMMAFVLVSLAGSSVLFLQKNRLVVTRFLGSIIFCLGGVALVGYAIEKPILYYGWESLSTAMAIHTAALFVVLGIGFFVLRDFRNNSEDSR